MMESFYQDLRYGLRMLFRNRLFTVVAVIALGLGIGANTAIFSVVNAVLLRPLPYEDSDKLVFVSEINQQLGEFSIAYPNFLDWHEQNQSFEHLAVHRRQSYTVTGGSEPVRVNGRQVSVDFFAVLRVKPILGNTFSTEDDKPGASPVAILSYGLWQRLFAGQADILGQTVILNAKPHVIIGVMPKGFSFPRDVEIWTPVGQQAALPGWMARANHPGIFGIARLKQGVTLEQARADMTAISERIEQLYPNDVAGDRVSLQPYLERLTKDIKPSLLVLFGAVGFLLLIACANVANLQLARGGARQKEMAVRSALGASRLRIIRQLLTESAVLALLGGGLGLMLAWWGVELLISISPGDTPRLAEINLDARVFAFSLLLSILTGMVFGLAPALQASKTDLNETLKESLRGSSTGPGSQRFRNPLIIAEVAISLLLLVGSGLMIKSFVRLQEVNPGFNPDNLITFELSLPRAQYPDDQQMVNFYKEIGQRIKALPGVEQASLASGLPLGNNGNQTAFVIEGEALPDPDKVPASEVVIVTPNHFRTLGMRLLQGRDFDERDTRDSPYVTVIDETFARRYWPDGDAVGKQIRFGGAGRDSRLAVVAGVVERVRMEGVDTDNDRVQSYFVFTQLTWNSMSVVARTSVDPISLANACRSEVQSVDKNQPVYNLRTMDQIWTESIASRRLTMFLLSAFAFVALLLATVGIYGVISYSVTQRTKEIGIRLALGAETGDVLKLILKQGLLLVLTGIALGLTAALVLTRWLEKLLFGVSPTDTLTFVAVSLILAVVGLAACLVPARRAARVDPMVALRYE
jgi:putative ABC transport system permease protein